MSYTNILLYFNTYAVKNQSLMLPSHIITYSFYEREDIIIFPTLRSSRVLVLNKWRRFAPPDKHTPMQLNSTHYTRKMKARRRAMLPLHRLQSCARFSTCGFSFLSLVLRLFPFSLLFGVCLLFQPKLRRYIRLRSNKKSRQKEATFYPRFLLWRQRLCP